MIAISIQGVGSGFVRVIRNDPAHPTSRARGAGVRDRPGGGLSGPTPVACQQPFGRPRRGARHPRTAASGPSCRPSARGHRPINGFHRPVRTHCARHAGRTRREAEGETEPPGPRRVRFASDPPVCAKRLTPALSDSAPGPLALRDLPWRDPTPHRDGWCTSRRRFGAVDASPS